MAREIRVTVDDDEVFERMKRRKRELDLSWEEVLHRGLRRGPDSDAPRDRRPDRDSHPRRDRRDESARYVRRDDEWGVFADNLESEIQDRVYDTLRSSLGAAGIEVPDRDRLDDDVTQLESAEDAVLVFDFLDDRPAHRVPLRVNLRTGPDGIDVDVVAVRQGKNVDHTNRFDGEARQRVNARLASGELARLRFGEGAEEYAVRPVLSWRRDEGGSPTVSDVEIDEVVVDDGR